MELYLLLVGVILLCVACVVILIAAFSEEGKRGKVLRRLEGIKESKVPETAKLLGEKKGRNWFITLLMMLGALLLPRNERQRRKLENKLYSAGIYSEDAVLIYLGLRFFVPAVLFFLALVFTPLYSHILALLILVPVCSLLLGIFAPVLVVRTMARNRKKEFMKGFPDALDLIAVCTEAGVGFDSAIKKVAEEIEITHKHISKEFKSYLYEQQIGIGRHAALRNLAQRMDVDIINAFVAVLIQSDKLGTSIVQTLRVYSDSLRTQRRQIAEIKAARRPIYLVFPLMFLILPCMFLVILGPASVNIFKNLVAK